MVNPILLSAIWRKLPAIAFSAVSGSRYGGLINVRRVEANVSVVGRENEVAGIGVNVRGRALEAQSNLVRIGARRDAEVVFQLSLVAVVNQIDARINRLILHLGKLRNVVTPLGTDRCQ